VKIGWHVYRILGSPGGRASLGLYWGRGAGNDYGHPHKVTLDKLAGAGVRVYRTDLSGSVTITSDGSTLSVSTGR
jgi:hypothetical protein